MNLVTDHAEIARLDEMIAENDAARTPHAEWKAADALFEKAAIVEDRYGPDAALPLYEEVTRRMHGATEAGPRELLLIALHRIAAIHENANRKQHSRTIAEAIIADHFQDAPDEAIDVVVDSALRLSRLLQDADEDDRALELMQRIVERYGGPDVPDHVLYRCAANAGIASLVAFNGNVEEGVRLYETVIDELRPCVELAEEIVLANALRTQAHYLHNMGRLADGDQRCNELLARFNNYSDPKILDEVEEARQMLNRSRRRQGRSFRLRRRGNDKAQDA